MEAVTAVGGPGCANGNQNMLTISTKQFCWGPLAFFIAYCIAVRHPARHALQLLLSVGQVYGDVLYYATNYAKQSVGEIYRAFKRVQQFDSSRKRH
ncbi:hypothetical protein APSETT444_000075 [Aspergillus pseudonomiae]